MAVLNGCCCCFSLRTGVIIIAVLYVVASVIHIGTTANSLYHHRYVDEEFQNAVKQIDTLVPGFKNTLRDTASTFDANFGSNGSGGARSAVDRTLADIQVTKPQLITTLVFTIIQALCGILLLFGAIKNKAGLLLPWIIVETLVLIAIVATNIAIAVELFKNDDTAAVGYATVAFVVIYISLSVYFILVVYSLYQSLRENPRPYV